MWAYESVFYQIYPLGFCGAPFENDGELNRRILKVEEWIPHIKELGCNAIYFSPLFESDTHGYNTRDFQKLFFSLSKAISKAFTKPYSTSVSLLSKIT